MDIQLIGFRRQSGIASKTGNPYDMPQLLALTPIEHVKNDKLTIVGKGYEVSVIPFDETKQALFDALKYPCNVDLQMDSRNRFGQFESYAVGVKLISADIKQVSQ